MVLAQNIRSALYGISYIIQNLISSRLQTGGRQRVCVLLGEHQQGRHVIVSSRQTGASQHKTR